MDASLLRRVQLTELDILLEIDRICTKNGIVYFLDSGTLLGAARHAGFIPWDDDVDIAMLRSDYDRFCAIAQSELGPEYIIQTPETDSASPFPMAKVRLVDGEFVQKDHAEDNEYQGFWVDVFPFDRISNDEKQLKVAEQTWRRTWLAYDLGMHKTRKGVSFKLALQRLVRGSFSLLPSSYYIAKTRELPEKFASDDGELYTCFFYFTRFLRLREEDIFPICYLPFEGIKLPVIAGWQNYLTDVYGDWRQLPPIEKRRNHNVSYVRFPGEENGIVISD